jgi:2-polyprenyl-3-methyl-5-hydroxy-6-metoxy-1,4-benzoquinol methylase
MKKRSSEKELIDLKLYTKEEYEDCLRKLNRIGRLLGSQRAMLKIIGKSTPTSILDVGCGGGAFTRALAKAYPQAKVVGTDIDKEAIDFAKNQIKPLPNLSFALRPLEEEAPKSFDVVTTTLVCHHLTSPTLATFLDKAALIAKKAVVCNDLHRHPLAYGLFALSSPILFPNRLIQNDGLVSIKRAFIRKDLEELFARFPLKKISWHWPFRWIVEAHV